MTYKDELKELAINLLLNGNEISPFYYTTIKGLDKLNTEELNAFIGMMEK